MRSRRSITISRWFLAFGSLAGIVFVYARWLHVNSTTVALTLLLLILVLASEWGLQFAIVISIVATASYNFFFLPPTGTFTIADPQNWIALFAFLTTSILASRLSERARNEARDARARQRELEILFRLSRELLHSESAAALLISIPTAVADVTAAHSGTLYLIEGDKLYQAGGERTFETEISHLHQLAASLTSTLESANEMHVPIRTGVRPRGLLTLKGAALSTEIADAIGSLISLLIERAQALENVVRSEAAKESERLRTLMIDSVTHELRTPLTSIKGAATALLSGAVKQEETQELLEIIDEESDRLNQLVSEAVEMAQLDAQQVQMHFSLVSVRDLIAEALKTCSWVEDQHPIEVNISDDLEVRADPAIFEKVICNLLENAAKYSSAGSPIAITAERRSHGVAISLSDHGTGIDPSEQALIFERFYRGRSQSDGTSGTGMGLAISRAIVEAHGGNITVASQLGHGSVFTLWIPSSLGEG